ncbi:MAG: ATP/GTP-binding protein, partial [Bacteroidota bacterium]|nr:ATP/GTP-binding protein [Bacteroidota bacterium]
MMNRYFLIVILALLVQANVVKAQHKLEKVWQTDSILKTPESVLFDAKEQLLYVANIDGQPWEKDGKGFISKLDLDGHVLNLHWVTGLHCPKGMTRVDNHLYVADADSLVTIDIISAKVVARSSTTGVEQLNDVTSDKGGRVYVTDSKTGKIYQLKGDALVLLVEGLKGLNGILSASGSLYAVAGGTLYKV